MLGHAHQFTMRALHSSGGSPADHGRAVSGGFLALASTSAKSPWKSSRPRRASKSGSRSSLTKATQP